MQTPQPDKLLVFTKTPIPGTVKTRLQSLLSPEQCVHLHCAMIEHTLTVAWQAGYQNIELWCSPSTHHHWLQTLCAQRAIQLRVQKGHDLGARMLHAIRTTLTTNPYTVLIGTDCPSITPDYLQQAFTTLATGHDIVLGPAEDGGYVLIGARQILPQIFADITWSTNTVLQQTLTRLTQSSLTWKTLTPLWDLDTAQDLLRLRNTNPHTMTEPLRNLLLQHTRRQFNPT